jgi:hypothetical protein
MSSKIKLTSSRLKAEIDNSINTVSIGAERFKADVRTFGGIFLLLGACAAFNPLANVAAGIIHSRHTLNRGHSSLGIGYGNRSNNNRHIRNACWIYLALAHHYSTHRRPD